MEQIIDADFKEFLNIGFAGCLRKSLCNRLSGTLASLMHLELNFFLNVEKSMDIHIFQKFQPLRGPFRLLASIFFR